MNKKNTLFALLVIGVCCCIQHSNATNGPSISQVVTYVDTEIKRAIDLVDELALPNNTEDTITQTKRSLTDLIDQLDQNVATLRLQICTTTPATKATRWFVNTVHSTTHSYLPALIGTHLSIHPNGNLPVIEDDPLDGALRDISDVITQIKAELAATNFNTLTLTQKLAELFEMKNLLFSACDPTKIITQVAPTIVDLSKNLDEIKRQTREKLHTLDGNKLHYATTDKCNYLVNQFAVPQPSTNNGWFAGLRTYINKNTVLNEEDLRIAAAQFEHDYQLIATAQHAKDNKKFLTNIFRIHMTPAYGQRFRHMVESTKSALTKLIPGITSIPGVTKVGATIENACITTATAVEIMANGLTNVPNNVVRIPGQIAASFTDARLTQLLTWINQNRDKLNDFKNDPEKRRQFQQILRLIRLSVQHNWALRAGIRIPQYIGAGLASLSENLGIQTREQANDTFSLSTANFANIAEMMGEDNMQFLSTMHDFGVNIQNGGPGILPFLLYYVDALARRQITTAMIDPLSTVVSLIQFFDNNFKGGSLRILDALENEQNLDKLIAFADSIHNRGITAQERLALFKNYLNNFNVLAPVKQHARLAEAVHQNNIVKNNLPQSIESYTHVPTTALLVKSLPEENTVNTPTTYVPQEIKDLGLSTQEIVPTNNTIAPNAQRIFDANRVETIAAQHNYRRNHHIINTRMHELQNKIAQEHAAIAILRQTNIPATDELMYATAREYCVQHNIANGQNLNEYIASLNTEKTNTEQAIKNSSQWFDFLWTNPTKRIAEKKLQRVHFALEEAQNARAAYATFTAAAQTLGAEQCTAILALANKYARANALPDIQARKNEIERRMNAKRAQIDQLPKHWYDWFWWTPERRQLENEYDALKTRKEILTAEEHNLPAEQQAAHDLVAAEIQRHERNIADYQQQMQRVQEAQNTLFPTTRAPQATMPVVPTVTEDSMIVLEQPESSTTSTVTLTTQTTNPTASNTLLPAQGQQLLEQVAFFNSVSTTTARVAVMTPSVNNQTETSDTIVPQMSQETQQAYLVKTTPKLRRRTARQQVISPNNQD